MKQFLNPPPPPLFKLTAMMLLLLVADFGCKKKEGLPIDTTTADFLVGSRTNGIDSVSLAAFNSVVNEPYEFFGQITYDHFKFRAGYTSPFDYLNPTTRNGFETNFTAYKNADSGKSMAQIADECVSMGALTANQATVFKNYFADLIAKANSETFVSFGTTWNYILQKEATLISSTANPEDLIPTIITSTSVRNLLKYQFESAVLAPVLNGGSVDERAGDCILGITLQCWFTHVTKGVLDSLKAALTAGFTVSTGGGSGSGTGSSGFNSTAFWNSLKIGGSLSIVIGTLTAFLDPSCKCTTPSAPAAVCAAPTGIDILIPDCSNIVTASARIVGINPNVTSWTITNGFLPDFNNITNPNNFTIQGTTLRVKPIDLTVPTKIAVANVCPGAGPISTGILSFNIPQIVRDPGTLFIDGPSVSSVGQTNTYLLSGTGISSINANNSITLGCSYHGTVQSSTPTSVSVKWTTSSSGGGGWGGSSGSAYVNATSHNTCSGNSSGASKAVTVN